ATIDALRRAEWREVRGVGFVCPFLLCPVCEGELVWRLADLDQQVEQLTCLRSPQCDGRAEADEIVLTRRQAQARPPDVTFTTAEMLNQRLSDSRRRPILGIASSSNRCARLLLLDEVHTYTGTAGAQTALTLRRWLHAVRS